jgi:ribonuclease P/MRP protein subunit RPP1
MANDITLFKTGNSIHLKKIKTKTEIKETDTTDGYLIDTNGNEKEARKIVDSLKGKNKKIAIQGHNNIFNRRILETMKIDYLIDIEKQEKRDTLKQRDSGLNHVTAKIAKANNIAIIINHTNIKQSPPKEKATQLSRIIQNLKITRRAKTQIKIASLAENSNQLTTPKERQTLLYTLGASSQQAKDSTKF